MPIPAFASDRYLRIVRASGWYDLLVTWPFALPWTFAWLYAQLNLLAQALALPGTLHPLDATHMLLANLLGSVVVVWSVARIVAPTVLLGRLDGVARFLFAAWQIYAVAHGPAAGSRWPRARPGSGAGPAVRQCGHQSPAAWRPVPAPRRGRARRRPRWRAAGLRSPPG